MSVASDGTQGNGYSFETRISANGQFVAFQSFASNLVAGDTNAFGDIFVHDRQTGITERVNVATDGAEGNDNSYNADISSDGRYVAFSSLANNLVSGHTNDFRDALFHDRLTGMTERVNVASDGTEADSWAFMTRISENGRYVVFETKASNLITSDTNGHYDIYIHDRDLDIIERVSVASDG